MIQTIILDSTPLGQLASPSKSPEVLAIKQWLFLHQNAGRDIIIPEINDYEVRRELTRTKKASSIARLDVLKASAYYVPITTDAMLLASTLWANARQLGVATADAKALDGDVIMCAQVLTLGLAPGTFVVATSNVNHIARYVPADVWSNIQP